MLKNALVTFVMLSLILSVINAQENQFQITHKGSILRLKFSPSGNKLLSYSSGNQDLVLWNVKSGNVIWKRPISFIQKADEYYTLNSLAWSPDEKTVATGSANGTVQLWEAKTGDFLWRAEVHQKDITAIKFSPDGKMIATTALSDKNAPVKLIQASDGKTLKIFEGDPCAGIAIAFDEEAGKLKIGNLDGNITEWDLRSGKQTAESVTPCRVMRTYDWETSYSGDLKVSIHRTIQSEILIKDNKTGSKITTVKGTGSKISSRISGDGKVAVIRESAGFRFFELETGENRPVNPDFSIATAFDLSDDGKLFAQEGKPLDTSIILTDIERGRTWVLDGRPSNINAITYSPDNKTLAVAGNDRNIYFFDPESRRLLRTLSGHSDRVTAIAFSPDGKTMISGDSDSVIKVWDISTGKLLREIKATESSNDIDQIEFDSSGKIFLTLINGSLTVWDSASMKPKIKIYTADGYESTSGRMTTTYSSVPINSAMFNVSGKSVVTGHSDGSIRLWDSATGKELNRFNLGEYVYFALPSPDGKHILAILDEDDEKKNLQLIDIQTGEVVRRSDNTDTTFLKKVSMSRDGKYLAVVGNIGDTEIWDLEKFTLLRELDYELSGSDSVAFSPDSKTFFIGGQNQNLYLYDTESGKKLWQLIPAFQPGKMELKLLEERKARVAAITELKNKREKQAEIYIEQFREKVYITFSHYGDMSDPGEKRMSESDELNESKIKKTAQDANAVWLRLHNDSPLPIGIPTQSMYFPNRDCFHLFSDGQKMLGLCDDREISIWFGVKNKNNEWIPYGFDFGSSEVLLPNKSVIFPVPLNILKDDLSIVFSYSFQNIKASENDRSWNYGKKIELKFGKDDLPN